MVVLALCTLFSCKEEVDKPGGSWSTGPIEVDQITPINGGATITYKIPKDPNLLYVMAEYERNGKMFTEKSSVHKNTLTIEGFNTMDKVPFRLYMVNKQEERSAPLELEFEPLESLISIAEKSLNMVPGFGGIVADWENPKSTEFGVRLMVEDEKDGLVTKEMYFSSSEKERRSFRGFEPEEATFAIAFEDKWGNISDTVVLKTTPFFETLVPKPYADFRASIPYDNITTLSGRNINTLWDNIVNTASHGWLTQSGGGSGISMTIDLKQVVKLSRIVIHGYHLNSVYGQVNITQFEAWGSKTMDFGKLADRPYWLDEYAVRNKNIRDIDGVNETTVLPDRTFKDDWEYLGWHAIPRYDRMVPPDPQGALNLAANGTEYEIPLDAGPVRYIRIFAREVAGSMPPPVNNYFSMGEITIYGDNTVPQQ